MQKRSTGYKCRLIVIRKEGNRALGRGREREKERTEGERETHREKERVRWASAN